MYKEILKEIKADPNADAKLGIINSIKNLEEEKSKLMNKNGDTLGDFNDSGSDSDSNPSEDELSKRELKSLY